MKEGKIMRIIKTINSGRQIWLGIIIHKMAVLVKNKKLLILGDFN